ncbi:MAG: phosphatase PAP2 family protein, partial [Gammaproteobacteria bacterium]|nr:phosphatase PAP2 family protein [Gammaproteobacteria bacterium]
AAGWFYHPENPDSFWPKGNFWLWQFFYEGVPALAAVLVLGSVFILIYSSLRGKLVQYKLAAGCVLLTILLGPGLLVNAIFKDHWCRPRPNQITEFGGHMQHIPPLMIGESRKGESFPAGHPSVGYSLAIFWLLLRGRKPKLATVAFITAILAGVLMGIGRMAAGGHFLSDVLWSGFMTFFAAIMVYYYILRVPQRRAAMERGEATLSTKTPAWQIAGYIVVGIGVLAGSLFGFPVDKDIHYKVSSADMPVAPRVITLNVDKANVEIHLRNNENPFLDIHAAIRGFGLPTNNIGITSHRVTEPVPQITYKLTHKGIYSELNSVVKLDVAARTLERLVVDVQQGDISVSQAGGLNHVPQLQLTTTKGQVIRAIDNP